MAEDWLATQQSITADLMNEGTSFIFRRKIEAEYDPIAGVYADSGERVFTSHGIFTSSGMNPPTAFMWQTEATVEQGDIILLLDCAAYSAQLGDLVKIDGVDWFVKSYAPLRPGGVPLLQYVLIKRA